MKNISLILFILLVVAVVFNVDKPIQKGEITKIEGKKYEVLKEIHDTIEVPKIVKGKTLPAIINTIHDTIPTKVDTLAILKDYYAKNIYSDSIRIDTNISVFISDTVQQNKIIGRYFMSNFSQKIITNTMIVKPIPTWHLYGGFDVSLDRVNFVNRVGGNLLLETKSSKLYGFGLGLTSQAQPYVSFQYYFKIK